MAESPDARAAQRQLARSVTELVHGEHALASAQRITDALFGGELGALSEADLAQLQQDGMGCTKVPRQPLGLLAALADGGLAKSRGEARRLVQSGGVSINGSIQSDPERTLDWSDALFGRFYLLRRGKKQWHLLTTASA
jgi:tyrosyl-tRNA synthetase